MKKIIFLYIMAIFLIQAGCKPEVNQINQHLISVSILPQKYFTEKISGNDYSINVMVPPGASPATYEPSPKQIKDLSDSDIYLEIGEIGFEETWIKRFERNNPDIPFLDVSKGIEFFESSHHHEGHMHTGEDPHIWMSPRNVLTISENIFQALITIYPEDSVKFRQNLMKFREEVRKIDSLYLSHSSKLNGKNFMIFHPALGYLARDYGMTQHVLEYEGKEPPPSHIANLINIAQKYNINTIFVQKQFSMDNAKSLAKEIDAEIIEIDPLNENWNYEMKKILNHLID